MKKRNPFSFLVYLAILGIVFFVILSIFRGVGNDVPYSKVVELLRKEQVKSFVISDGKIHMKLHTEYDGEKSLVTGISDPELFRQEVGELVQQQYEAGIEGSTLSIPARITLAVSTRESFCSSIKISVYFFARGVFSFTIFCWT